MEVYTGLVSFSWNIVFQVINFLILVALLYKFLFNPVQKMLEKRKNTIAADLNNAAEKSAQAEALKADYEQKIKDINVEADSIRREARRQGEARAQEIITDARGRYDEILQKAQVESDRERRNAYNELKDSITDMVLDAAGKVIGENMDDELNEKLVVKFIEEAGDVKWQN